MGFRGTLLRSGKVVRGLTLSSFEETVADPAIGTVWHKEERYNLTRPFVSKSFVVKLDVFGPPVRFIATLRRDAIAQALAHLEQEGS